MSSPHRVRSMGRRVLAPIARPLLVRLDQRNAVRIEAEVARVLESSLDPHIDALVARHVEEEHRRESPERTLAAQLPTLLGSLTSNAASAREARRTELELSETITSLAARIEQVADRGEFIRRELMLAVRDETGRRGVDVVPEPKVLAPEKLAQSPLRVNLGCGHLPLAGYVNVDARELPAVDVVADVGNLPFDRGTVDEIHAAHLVEHFPLEELRRVVLPGWRDSLAPGGLLRIVVPDASTMISEYAAGRYPFEDLRRVTFGDQEHEGDFHFSMFTPDSARELLEGAGFVEVEVVDHGRRTGACYEMELVARRPSA